MLWSRDAERRLNATVLFDRSAVAPRRLDCLFGRGPGAQATAYSYPRVIHRSEESPQELLPAASVNNSAAQKVLGMNLSKISHNQENTHRPVTNSTARHSTPNGSPSSRAMRWSLTNTQWRTASISRSHYKPFARISQRVFSTR